MNILICHERFVFRYGVDRVLLALTREFVRAGYRVTLFGLAFDAGLQEVYPGTRIVKLPSVQPTTSADAHATAWIADHWEEHFGGAQRPDIVLSAGWPFLSSIPLFESRGCRVVYQDHGVIPKDGLPEIGWRSLSLLEELKRIFLPCASGVVAVSQFICDTQSRACVRDETRLRVILNGVDHLGGVVEDGSRGDNARRSGRAAGPLRIICAGRFEPGTYKQSELIFALEERVRAWAPDAWIGVLATPEAIAAAAGGEGRSRVVALGFPDDAAMAAWIRGADALVSLSAWEGFNLPLAEAQVLGTPALAFDIGAHREVVADPWQLCRDFAEMDAKLRTLVGGGAPAGFIDGSVFASWMGAHRWQIVAERYLGWFDELLAATVPDSEPTVRAAANALTRAREAAERWSDVERWVALDATISPRRTVPGRISFLVSTRNRLEQLRACVESLVRFHPAHVDAEWMIIDDASRDGTRAWLGEMSARHPGIRIVRHEIPRGRGASLNRAAQEATGEILAIVDDRQVFAPGWLEAMLSAWHERPGRFAMGGVLCPAADASGATAGVTFSPEGQPEPLGTGDLRGRGDVCEVPALMFLGALVDREKFLELGGLDPRFADGIEDVDMCLRARARGWPSGLALRGMGDAQLCRVPRAPCMRSASLAAFLERWQSFAIVLGRDWEESQFWMREAARGVPDDGRRPGALRVLVDLTAPDQRDAATTGDGAGFAVELCTALAHASAIAVIVIEDPRLSELDAPRREANRVERWIWSDDPKIASSGGLSVIGGPAITVARRLGADVLVAPSGWTRFATPCIPAIVPSRCAPGRSHAAFQFADSVGIDMDVTTLPQACADLAARFRRAGISWRWIDAVGGRRFPWNPSRETRDAGLDRIRYCIDEPLRADSPVPLQEIRGWCLHLEGLLIMDVYAVFQDGATARGVAGRARPDVAAAFPVCAGAGTSGFSLRIPGGLGLVQLWVSGPPESGFAAMLQTWDTGDRNLS